jgi:type IV secretion system protein VirB10
MEIRHKWLFSLAFGLSLAPLGLYAQDANPAPPPAASPDAQPATGWRQFNGPGQDQQFADAAPPTVGPPQLVLPAGMLVTVRVNQPLSSDHNQVGDGFSATLTQPLVANGIVVARRGQVVQGRVAEAKKAGRVTGTSRLGLELAQIVVVDGQQIPIHSQLVERRGNTSVGRDAAAIGTTTGVGAAIGAAAAGGVGAGIGAGAGAVASVIGVLVTRGQPTVVFPEMLLTFRLASPVVITPRSEQAFLPVTPQDYAQPVLVRRGPPPYPGPPPYYGGFYAAPYPYFYGPSVYFYGGPRFFYRRW